MGDKQQRTALIIALISILIVSGLVFFRIILPQDSFHWDESHHAFFSVQLFHAIAGNDWGSFWHWTDRQALWPFFHSWLLTVFFFVFGLSATTARFLSLTIFACTAFLAYLTANKLNKNQAWLGGLVAVGLIITSPLMLSFAAQNMLEGLGALEFLLAIYVYLLAKEREQIGLYLLLGVILSLTVVTKYNYSFLTLSSFLVIFIGDLIYLFLDPAVKPDKVGKLKNKKKSKSFSPITLAQAWLKKSLVVALPIILIAWLWFSTGDTQRKHDLLLWSKSEVAEKQNVTPDNWTNFSFYPKVIVGDITFSPWLGGLLLFSLLMPLAYKKNKNIRPLYLAAWVTLLLSIFVIGNKLNRLIYPILPLIYLLFAANFIGLIGFIKEKYRLRKKTVIIIFLALLLPAIFSLARLVKIWGGDISDISHGTKAPARKEKFNDVLKFFHESIPNTYSVSTAISYANYLSPYVFSFYFHDWQAPFYNQFYVNDPNFINSDFFLSLEAADQQKYGVLEWNAFLRDQATRGKILLYKEKDFPSLGIKAKIYMGSKVNLLHK